MENGMIVTVNELAPLDPSILQAQVNAIQKSMKQVMQEGIHFGKVPGCGDKPALFKPGAEKLAMMFRLIPVIDVLRQDLANNHREYTVTVTLKNPQGQAMGQGVGSCSTMEAKYRYRKGGRKCPKCGKEAIIKGKEEYGGGWLCYAKKGGCNSKFQDGDRAIESQSEDRVENLDIADQYNTVLKMAKKRGLVDAVLTATAASDLFTQDIEEGFAYPEVPTKLEAVQPAKAETVESQAQPVMRLQYDLSSLDPGKLPAAIKMLMDAGAMTTDEEYKLYWESPKEVKKLQNYLVKEAA